MCAITFQNLEEKGGVQRRHQDKKKQCCGLASDGVCGSEKNGQTIGVCGVELSDRREIGNVVVEKELKRFQFRFGTGGFPVVIHEVEITVLRKTFRHQHIMFGITALEPSFSDRGTNPNSDKEIERNGCQIEPQADMTGRREGEEGFLNIGVDGFTDRIAKNEPWQNNAHKSGKTGNSGGQAGNKGCSGEPEKREEEKDWFCIFAPFLQDPQTDPERREQESHSQRDEPKHGNRLESACQNQMCGSQPASASGDAFQKEQA